MKAIMIEIDASIHPDNNWENNGYPVRDGSARFAVIYPKDNRHMMILVSDDKKKWRPAIGVPLVIVLCATGHDGSKDKPGK